MTDRIRNVDVLSAVVLAGDSRRGGVVEIELTRQRGPFQVEVWPDDNGRWWPQGRITELDSTGHVLRPTWEVTKPPTGRSVPIWGLTSAACVMLAYGNLGRYQVDPLPLHSWYDHITGKVS